jgi:hypothetical protein
MEMIKTKIKFYVCLGLMACLSLSISTLNAQVFQKDNLKPLVFTNYLNFKPTLIIDDKSSFMIPKFDRFQLPFFCKMEHKIESISKIAFRFRLGDLNYVNILENK